MYILKRTNSDDPDFIVLVNELDKDLALRNGDTNGFFAQYNKTHLIKNVVVVYDQNEPVGCGAMKELSPEAMEIKRMFVPIEKRGKGIAKQIVDELLKWAKELGYQKCVLETGDKMPEAIRLYKKSGFKTIPNYGPYINVESSVCFEKEV